MESQDLDIGENAIFTFGDFVMEASLLCKIFSFVLFSLDRDWDLEDLLATNGFVSSIPSVGPSARPSSPAISHDPLLSEVMHHLNAFIFPVQSQLSEEDFWFFFSELYLTSLKEPILKTQRFNRFCTEQSGKF